MVERGARPIGRVHIEELRGARNRDLIFHPARQEEIEIVRKEKAPGRQVGHGGTARDNLLELEARIVKYVWNSGRRVNPIEGGPRARQPVEPRAGPGVAISMHREDEPAQIVDERVIHAPGVDAHRSKVGAAGQGRGSLSQADPHLLPKRADVPVIVAGQRMEVIGEPVGFRQREPIFRPGARDHPAARRAEINRSTV